MFFREAAHSRKAEYAFVYFKFLSAAAWFEMKASFNLTRLHFSSFCFQMLCIKGLNLTFILLFIE